MLSNILGLQNQVKLNFMLLEAKIMVAFMEERGIKNLEEYKRVFPVLTMVYFSLLVAVSWLYPL